MLTLLSALTPGNSLAIVPHLQDDLPCGHASPTCPKPPPAYLPVEELLRGELIPKSACARRTRSVSRYGMVSRSVRPAAGRRGDRLEHAQAAPGLASSVTRARSTRTRGPSGRHHAPVDLALHGGRHPGERSAHMLPRPRPRRRRADHRRRACRPMARAATSTAVTAVAWRSRAGSSAATPAPHGCPAATRCGPWGQAGLGPLMWRQHCCSKTDRVGAARSPGRAGPAGIADLADNRGRRRPGPMTDDPRPRPTFARDAGTMSLVVGDRAPRRGRRPGTRHGQRVGVIADRPGEVDQAFPGPTHQVERGHLLRQPGWGEAGHPGGVDDAGQGQAGACRRHTAAGHLAHHLTHHGGEPGEGALRVAAAQVALHDALVDRPSG